MMNKKTKAKIRALAKDMTINTERNVFMRNVSAPMMEAALLNAFEHYFPAWRRRWIMWLLIGFALGVLLAAGFAVLLIGGAFDGVVNLFF